MKLTDLAKCFTTLREVVSTNLIDSDIIMKTQVGKIFHSRIKNILLHVKMNTFEFPLPNLGSNVSSTKRR